MLCRLINGYRRFGIKSASIFKVKNSNLLALLHLQDEDAMLFRNASNFFSDDKARLPTGFESLLSWSQQP